MCWFVDVECTRHTYTENGHIKCNCVSLVCRLGIYITELCGNINAAEDTMGTCKPTAYPIHPPHYPFFFSSFLLCCMCVVVGASQELACALGGHIHRKHIATSSTHTHRDASEKSRMGELNRRPTDWSERVWIRVFGIILIFFALSYPMAVIYKCIRKAYDRNFYIQWTSPMFGHVCVRTRDSKEWECIRNCVCALLYDEGICVWGREREREWIDAIGCPKCELCYLIKMRWKTWMQRADEAQRVHCGGHTVVWGLRRTRQKNDLGEDWDAASSQFETDEYWCSSNDTTNE